MHNLLHLTESVEQWGPLYGASTYKFENYNQELKKPTKILEQIKNKIDLSWKHGERIAVSQKRNRLIISTSEKDAYFKLKNGAILKVTKITRDCLKGHEWRVASALFISPFNSKDVGIVKILDGDFSKDVEYDNNDIDFKYMALPMAPYTVLIPIIHAYF